MGLYEWMEVVLHLLDTKNVIARGRNKDYSVLKITPPNSVDECIVRDGPEVVGKVEGCNTRLSSTCLGLVETLLLHEIALKCTIM